MKTSIRSLVMMVGTTHMVRQSGGMPSAKSSLGNSRGGTTCVQIQLTMAMLN